MPELRLRRHIDKLVANELVNAKRRSRTGVGIEGIIKALIVRQKIAEAGIFDILERVAPATIERLSLDHAPGLSWTEARDFRHRAAMCALPKVGEDDLRQGW